YFPVVYAVKSTMAALAGTALLLLAGLWKAHRGAGAAPCDPVNSPAPSLWASSSKAARGRGTLSRGWFERLRAIPIMGFGLVLPPLVYFTLSMSRAINIGMRHILLVYPLLYVGLASMM